MSPVDKALYFPGRLSNNRATPFSVSRDSGAADPRDIRSGDAAAMRPLRALRPLGPMVSGVLVMTGVGALLGGLQRRLAGAPQGLIQVPD
jgi:hypothetical protein